MDLIKKIALCVFFISIFVSGRLWAQEGTAPLVLDQTDRILVVAPHPDDEVIGAAGVIQEAVKRKLPVRVLYLTNGDSNSLAFLYYQKRPVFGRRQAIKMGELRQREASAAMKSLGIDENQMVFLGYPDYGTLNIFKKYWNSLKSYRSILTKVDHNPYPLSLTPGAQYKAVEILDDFKKVIRDFGPTKIFVTHPADNNADHQAAFLFVQVALWDLGMDSQNVSILTYLVHHTNWPSPLGYHPEIRLSPPKYLQVPYIQWFDFDLDSRQLTAKKEAIQFFKTQIPYKPKFLFTFVRQNELFAVNQKFRLAASGSSVLDWSKEEKVQSAMINNRMRKPFHNRLYHSVVYALSENKLNLRIRLNQSYSQDVSMDIYLFGYTRNVLFKDMPKIHLKLDKNMNAEVYDGMKHLRRNGVHVSKSGNDLVISLPLALLNTPEKVFGSVGLRIQSLPLESSSWEVMEMDYGT